MLIDMFFACFYTFYFLNQTDHFAKAMVFAWAIAFARWPIFKIVSFIEYLVFFQRFLHRTTLVSLYNHFPHVFGYFNF